MRRCFDCGKGKVRRSGVEESLRKSQIRCKPCRALMAITTHEMRKRNGMDD